MKALILSFFLISSFAFAEKKEINQETSSVGFHIIKFKIKKLVDGKFSKFSGHIDQDGDMIKSVNIKIDASSIDTMEEKRDAHLRSPDFFDVTNHKEITFTSNTPVKIGKTFDIKGKLTIKNVSNDVTLKVFMVKKDLYRSQLVIDRSVYGVSWNRPLGFNVDAFGQLGDKVIGDNVTIKILANFAK